MKILERKEFKWELEVICKDSNWRQEKEQCGSKLLVDKDDIYYRDTFKYPDQEWRTYGIICPICNNYVEIEQDKIPKSVKSAAKSYTDKIKLDSNNIQSEKNNNDPNPCNIKGCDSLTRQSCCGCQEQLDWERRNKNNGNNN